MKRRHVLQSSVLMLLARPIGKVLAADPPKAPHEAQLIRIAEQAIKDGAAPGVQIATYRDGHPLLAVNRGLSNLETNSSVSAATIFRAGSLTKQFTAALVAKLADMGRLDVSHSVGKYLDFWPVETAPTLLQLIHHTAGVHEEESDLISWAPLTQIDLAKRIARQDKLTDFAPGTAWRYSNANYIVLGAVVEAVTGQSLSQAALQYLLQPLSLSNTRFDHHCAVVRGRASGYTRAANDSEFVSADPIPIEQTGGAGAIRSTADDLCRWHHALLYGDWLSRASRAALLQPAALSNGTPITQGRFDAKDSAMGETSYGYGLMLDPTPRVGSLVMHNGFVSGYSAYLATHVPSRLTLACLCNADPGPALPFRFLRRAAFAEYL